MEGERKGGCERGGGGGGGRDGGEDGLIVWDGGGVGWDGVEGLEGGG